MTDRLRATPQGMAAAAEILREGGLVAFPTDTVYGVACIGTRPDRVQALFELKRRPPEKQIPMLVAGLEQVPDGWVVDGRARALARRYWPGALTLVLPATTSGSSQAFRAPDHEVARALIDATGPLLATSANISGQPDTLDADDVLIAFATQREELDAVVDGGRVPGGVASTVVDLSVTPARVLRDGPISRASMARLIPLNEVDDPT
jgi:L-threonylcarbamoyladenylate synthase